MSKKLQFVLGAVAFVALMTIAVFGYNTLQDAGYTPDNPVQEIPEEDRRRAPDFTVLDWDGNEVRLSDLRGKPVVLNFWATWCPNCVIEMPYFQELHSEMGDEIHIVKVNLLDGQRETRASVEDFMAERDYDFQVWFDTTGEASGLFGVRFIPVTFFIDAEGYLVTMIQGTVDEHRLRQAVEMAMNLPEFNE